ncbi:MAG: extracellular solute-binding protein [Anaerolineae bacterium]|nr:extracellular solute-binding protein [Anaerolineae bacterium]
MSEKGLNRRQFLKALGASGAGVAAAAAGLPVAAASGRALSPANVARAQNAEIVLQTASWPYNPLPEAEPEGGYSAYEQALTLWLEDNPNVRIETVEVGIWDTSALLTAIAGGTAPAYFSSGVIGSWSVAGLHAAYTQGLVADITEQFQAYNFNDKFSDLMKAGAVWYTLGDQVFGVANEVAPGNGIYYRKDWLAEAGLPEPTVDWTWDDVREYAKALTTADRKGLVTQNWGMGWQLGAEGLGENNLLSRIPDPSSSWNWRWDYSSQLETYENTINRYRGMAFEDESILSDVTFNDGSVAQSFYNEEAAMVTNPSQFYTRVTEPWPYALAQNLDKPMEELVGFMTHPRGMNGHINPASRVLIPPTGLNPDLSSAEKDAALNLYNYMEMEDGFDLQRRLLFEETGDLKQAFSVFPFPRAKDTIDGVEGTAADAWGEDFIAVLDYHAKVVSGYPENGLYFPAEENIGPTVDAWTDAQSTFSYERGDLDIPAILKQAEDTRNQQAAGFTSSTPDDVFIEGATAYYAAHDAYWSEFAPDFHENVFSPWYESVIKPALGL